MGGICDIGAGGDVERLCMAMRSPSQMTATVVLVATMPTLAPHVGGWHRVVALVKGDMVVKLDGGGLPDRHLVMGRRQGLQAVYSPARGRPRACCRPASGRARS